MKTMCPPSYHHNGFVATDALGHMMYGLYIYVLYIYIDVLHGLQDQVTTKLKSSLGDCSGRVRITLAVNFLYFLYLHPRSELISG